MIEVYGFDIFIAGDEVVYQPANTLASGFRRLKMLRDFEIKPKKSKKRKLKFKKH